jgi:hypothetical protein
MSRLTKKELALSMHASGRSVEDIAQTLKCAPSYVANTLIAAGQTSDYSDLYTSSVAQNAYARMFSGVLRFKNVAAARESVARIDALFHQFELERDRRGQHQAQLMALIGKNRAEGIGKVAEARVFLEWLTTHLDTTETPACDPQTSFEGFDMSEEPQSSYADMSPYEAALAYA